MIDLNQVRVLSLDAFDTLLLRSVAQPADVFPLLATRAVDRGLLSAHVTPMHFSALRRRAEERARHVRSQTSGSSEVSLADIYAAWPGGSLPHAPALARLEVQIERELVYAHPAMLALVQEARARGIATALVSDTYFGRDDLCALLEAAHVSPEWFDVVLVSSEAACSKQDGRLFQRLLAHWPDVAASAVLHVGDHPHADVQQARRAGLTAVQHDTGRRDVVHNVLRLEALRYGRVLPELTSLRALASTLDAPSDREARWYFVLGASVLGPALATFADWVVDEAVRDGIRTVRPLMREGALFADLIARAAEARGADLDVKPLYASRSATWLASLDAFDHAAVHTLLQRQHLSIAEVLCGLGLEGGPAVAALTPFAEVTLGAAPGVRTLNGQSAADLLIEILGREDVRARVSAAISDARRLVQAYLDEACGSASGVALVDLGFHGSIGRALERASGDASPRHYHHFLAFAAEGVAKLWAAGADVRVFGAGPGDHADLAGPIARHPGLLEALLIEGGTTLSYEWAGTRVTPVLGDVAAPAAQQRAAAACRAGIRRFQECWLDWRLRRPALARLVLENRRSLTIPVHRLITMPTADEASRLGAFVHEDNEGGRSVRPLADASELPDTIGPEQFLRATLSGGPAFGHRWLWPAAVCEQRWPGFLERQWRDAAGTGDGAPPLMPAVAMRMRQAGVLECVVWGAGEAGMALIKAIREEGIAVLVATDSNPAHWGTELDGVRVVSPAEARRSGNHIFAIGSCAFATDIERTLRGDYRANAHALRIFSPVAEMAA